MLDLECTQKEETGIISLFSGEVVSDCLTLHDPMDCSLPGSSVYGIS